MEAYTTFFNKFLELASGELSKLYLENPTNNGFARNLAGIQALLGSSWTDAGDPPKAIQSFQQGIDTLRSALKSAPDDARLRITLALSLVRIAPLLLSSGHSPEAIAAGKGGLEVFRTFADRPNATPDDLNNYASFLLDVGVPDLKDAQTALSYAKRAVTSVSEPSLPFLSTLGDAYCETGDFANAIAIAERALARHPSPSSHSDSGGLRREFEEKLTKFRIDICH